MVLRPVTGRVVLIGRTHRQEAASAVGGWSGGPTLILRVRGTDAVLLALPVAGGGELDDNILVVGTLPNIVAGAIAGKGCRRLLKLTGWQPFVGDSGLVGSNRNALSRSDAGEEMANSRFLPVVHFFNNDTDAASCGTQAFGEALVSRLAHPEANGAQRVFGVVKLKDAARAGGKSNGKATVRQGIAHPVGCGGGRHRLKLQFGKASCVRSAHPVAGLGG